MSVSSEFDPTLNLFKVSRGVKRPENIDYTWKFEANEVATENPFPMPLQKWNVSPHEPLTFCDIYASLKQ